MPRTKNSIWRTTSTSTCLWSSKSSARPFQGRCVMERRGAIGCSGSAIVIVRNATIPLADAADDLVPFEELREQFTIALPGGWNVYNQSGALSGERGPFGVVFFSAQPLTKPGEKTADMELLSKA